MRWQLQTKTLFLGLLVFMSLPARPDCSRPLPDEPYTSRTEWNVIRSKDSASQSWKDLYQSGRRLRNRAYLAEDLSYVFPDGTKIPSRFLNSLKAQIATAIDRKYADHVFYPDLGHVHLLIPEGTQDLSDESALSRPDLIFLYHTAELYEMRPGGELSPDPWLQWRFYSRNLVGHNDERADVDIAYTDEKYGTVRGLPGYRQVETVYLSTSKNGCFELNTAEGNLKLDLSLSP
jgi:hypothetical protein